MTSSLITRSLRQWRPVKLDNNFFESTAPLTVNPNTHQKLILCVRLYVAEGLALYICPERPGAAS